MAEHEIKGPERSFPLDPIGDYMTRVANALECIALLMALERSDYPEFLEGAMRRAKMIAGIS